MGGRTIKCIWHCFLVDKGSDQYLSPIQALPSARPVSGDAYRSEPLSTKKQCHMHILSFDCTCMWITRVNLLLAKGDYIRFNPFYYPIKSQLLGTKCVFKHQDLQMFDLKINKV